MQYMLYILLYHEFTEQVRLTHGEGPTERSEEGSP